jgi:hypothetical protein
VLPKSDIIRLRLLSRVRKGKGESMPKASRDQQSKKNRRRLVHIETPILNVTLK